jgi:hypothetical protein
MKHFDLTRPPREGPEITNKNVTVGLLSDRPAEASFTFTFPDRTTRDALELARNVVADWEQLLKNYGVDV